MATRTTLHVEVVTGERQLYSGEADKVVATSVEGQFTVLPRHAALLAILAPGVLHIDLGEGEETMFVSGGFLEVSDNKVTVLADAAEHAEEIDVARAEEARRQAQQRLTEAGTDVDRAQLHSALERAVGRLRITELVRRRSRRRIDMPGSQ